MTSVFVLAGAARVLRRDPGERLGARLWQQPDLNAQRANVRATDENVPRPSPATARRSMRVPMSAGPLRRRVRTGIAVLAECRQARSTLIHAARFGVRDQPERSSTASGPTNSVRQAESHVLGARETLSNNEQNVLFDARLGLYERPARHRDSRSAAQQRRGYRRAAAADPRSLQRRRSHPHGRGAGRSAPCRLPVAGQPRRGQPAHQHRAATARSSASSRASWRPAGRSTSCVPRNVDCGPEDRLQRASGHQGRAAWRRCGRAAGEDRAGRACAATRRVVGAVAQRYDSQSRRRQTPVGLSRRAADRADLRGRPGLCAHPPGQGDRPASGGSRPIRSAIRSAPP